MATLTETAYYTRRVIKYGTLALIFFIIFKYAFGVVSNVWRQLHPPPPPPPTVAFGKLPAIVFPEQQNLPKLSYRLETIQGRVPELEKIGKVYFMPHPAPNLLAFDRAKEAAKKMGFTAPPRSVSPTVYQWSNQATPPTTLEMNIVNGNFTMRYAYENDQALFNQTNLPSTEQAATEAKNFLGTNKLLTDDLKAGRVEFAYLRFAPPTLITAISLSEADFVRVNIFRADQDELRILPPDPKNALVSFLFSGSREVGKRILEVNYTHYPLEKNTLATYPLKTSTQAWSELQSGGGYIANLGQNEKGEITIRRVYLAYFDTETPQSFLQPIFVFEGDQEFFAYVAAVSPEWTQEPATGD
jgi:hypothetical protein